MDLLRKSYALEATTTLERAMNQKPEPERMENREYDLKASTKEIGQLYPVLKAKDGEILDGFHRTQSDPSWKTVVLENIDSEEKKLLARLVANFHRRQIPRGEKTIWINSLAELYQKEGLRVEGKRGKGQGPNEIVQRICLRTGIAWRTVMEYLHPCFKQENYRRTEPGQHQVRSSPRDIIMNALGSRDPEWAETVVQRFQEEHEKELLNSPLFRKKILDSMPKVNVRPVRPASLCSPQNDPEIQKLMKLSLSENRPRCAWETFKEKRARLEKENQEGYEPIPDLYPTFIQECPNCLCGTCVHMDTCIERVRPGD
jgi:hypothetical protein